MSNSDIFSIEKVVEAIIKYSKDAQVMQVLRKSGYDIVSYSNVVSTEKGSDLINLDKSTTEKTETKFALFVLPQAIADNIQQQSVADDKNPEYCEKGNEQYDEVLNKWALILERLKEISVKQYAYLEHTKPVFIANDSVYVLFPDIYRAYKDKIQANTENFVSAIKETTEQNLKIVYILKEELVEIDAGKDLITLKS